MAVHVNEQTANWDDIRCPSSNLVPTFARSILMGWRSQRDRLSPLQGHLRLLAWELQREERRWKAPLAAEFSKVAHWQPTRARCKFTLLFSARPLQSMKGDPMRSRGELFMIPWLIAAFVGVFFVSVCEGSHPNGFRLWGFARAAKGFGKMLKSTGVSIMPDPKNPLNSPKNKPYFLRNTNWRAFTRRTMLEHKSDSSYRREESSKSSCFRMETPESNCLYQLLQTTRILVVFLWGSRRW